MQKKRRKYLIYIDQICHTLVWNLMQEPFSVIFVVLSCRFRLRCHQKETT